MNKIILDKTQLSLLILKNRYQVDKKTKFSSRCIDGRYSNDENLPALAFPGADAGELALVLATAKMYAFEVDREKVYQSLVEVVGGEKNLHFHSDSHSNEKKVLAGCGHIKHMGLTPSDYQLDQDDVDFIRQKFEQAVKKGARQDILHGDHMEGAVVYVKGDFGIYPRGDVGLQIFEYHQSLVDQRHRSLIKTLIKNKAVKIPKGTDEDYFFQVLSDMADVQTLETVKRLAKNLPIFQVVFDNDGIFKITELGIVN